MMQFTNIHSIFYIHSVYSIILFFIIIFIASFFNLYLSNFSMAQNHSGSKAKLTATQKHVIFENGTEKPFDNEYWNNKSDGIYVDIISGEPLFSSQDKFDSGTGWPSFTQPITKKAVQEKLDSSYGMHRVEVRSGDSDIHLGHVFNDGPQDKGVMRYCINSASLRFIPKEQLTKEGYGQYLQIFESKENEEISEEKHKTAEGKNAGNHNKKQQKAIIAGGCFWGMEDLFAKLEGVTDVVNGYTGGNIPNPTYEIITLGISNHAEAIEITFDASKISYDEIIRFFFKIHDPTTLNKQGNDVGTQYRSAIFYLNEEQKKIAENLIAKADKSGVFASKIVTTLEKFDKFYKAEEYHQDYLIKNPGGYSCHAIRKNIEF